MDGASESDPMFPSPFADVPRDPAPSEDPETRSLIRRGLLERVTFVRQPAGSADAK